MNRGELHRLFLLIKGLRGTIVATGKATSEAIAENAKADQKASEPQPSRQPERVRIEVDLSAEEARRYYAEQDKTYRLQGRTFWATVGTLLAVVGYAVITWLQWQTMNATLTQARNQTTLTRQSFEASQRAYLSAGDPRNTWLWFAHDSN